MDILISILTKDLLETRVAEFIDILADEPHEYWKEEHFRLPLDNKYDLSIVAITEPLIAGYIIASMKVDGPYIHKFFVRKEYRSKLIGEKMLRYFEKNIIRKGFGSVSLTVREDNPGAIKFYVRNKFEVCGTKTDGNDKSKLLIMKKPLTVREKILSMFSKFGGTHCRS